MPELGEVSVDYRLRGSFERFQVEGLNLKTETAQGLETAFTGVIMFDRDQNQQLIGKLDIQARVSAPAVTAATVAFGIDNFPDLPQLQANALISGTTIAPVLKNIDLKAGDPAAMQVRLEGDLGSIPVSEHFAFSGVNMTATIVAGSTDAVSSRLGYLFSLLANDAETTPCVIETR